MTTISPDAKHVWRVARGPVLIGVIVVAAAILISLLGSSTGKDGVLDPEATTPTGSRALARLLADRGVRVDRVSTLDDAREAVNRNATLLITQPDWLTPEGMRELVRRAGTTVAIGAGSGTVNAMVDRIRVASRLESEVRAPGCIHPIAKAVGSVRLGGIAYEDGCYDGTFIQRGNVILFGDGTPLTNEYLAQEGNAALTLRVLGQHEQLVWYLPELTDAGAGARDKSFYDLVPAGWQFGVWQVAVAVVLFMLWRGRRLGPIVTEPLPIVVRAAETAEGRARLYRRAGATDHAALALRNAALAKLVPLLGLTGDTTQPAIVESAAARTGRPPVDVHAVLFGPPPNTEQALVQLADALDDLVDEVGSR